MKKIKKIINSLILLGIITLNSCEISIKRNPFDGIIGLKSVIYKGKDVTNDFAGNAVSFDDDGIAYFPYLIEKKNGKNTFLISEERWNISGDSIFIQSENYIINGRYKLSSGMENNRRYYKFHSKTTDIILLKVYGFENIPH